MDQAHAQPLVSRHGTGVRRVARLRVLRPWWPRCRRGAGSAPREAGTDLHRTHQRIGAHDSASVTSCASLVVSSSPVARYTSLPLAFTTTKYGYALSPNAWAATESLLSASVGKGHFS